MTIENSELKFIAIGDFLAKKNKTFSNEKNIYLIDLKNLRKKNKNYNNLFHLLRYLSYWISIPFIYLPFTPNQITFFANFLQVSSIIIIAYADGYFKFYGLLLYFIGGIFDFVDGNIARFKKKTSKKVSFMIKLDMYLLRRFFILELELRHITIIMIHFIYILQY